MAKKGSFSKVYDKNGDYADVEAVRFDGTRTIQMQGDVTASQTWNGDPSAPLTLNASIGAKKVTTDKINDKAVQTGQIDDGAVGLPQIDTNAMNGTVQDNDSKLATHAAVKTYVDAQISGQGTYLGKHTVAEINAMVTDNLHNGDRLMTSDSGTVNLGPGGVGFDVEVGEDLILYKSGSTVQWDSMDGNFKTKQTAVSDPTASGTGMTFIDSIFQDENGEISATKKTVQDGTTSQKGVVELEDSTSSTSTTKAATPNSVKAAYDLAKTANTGLDAKVTGPSSATAGGIAVFDGTTGKLIKDSGVVVLPSTSTWDGKSDANVPTAKAVQAKLDGKQDSLPTSGNASSNYAINVTGWSSIVRSIQVRSPLNDKCWAKIAETDRNNQTDFSIAFNVHNDGYVIKSAYIGVLSASFAQKDSGDTFQHAIYFFRSDAIEFDTIKAVGVNTGSKIELWVCNKRKSQYVYFTPISCFRFHPVYGEDQKYTQAEFESYVAAKHAYNSVEKGVNRDGSGEVGSPAVPVWVNANGTLTRCTDDFARDSEVVSSVQVETVGNTTKMTYTKNGSKTDILTFMDDSEAVAIWNDAKTAASNAS